MPSPDPVSLMEAGQLAGVVRAMASDITIHGRTTADAGVGRAAIERALAVFPAVDAACTRFSPDSPLMRVNGQPGAWHDVPTTLYRTVLEAHHAYERTRGRFDPRILADLVRLGYDRSLPFAEGAVVASEPRSTRRPLGRWKPKFRGGPHPQLHLGGVPIDLGGIGKGLAARWASERLIGSLDGFLVDAGGDCIGRGAGPDGAGWRIGIEDPRGGPDPMAVLELRDLACATSSIRLRTWRAGERTVHHLIDPRTGRSGGEGLLSVTVIAADPAEAEVLSKTLFLAGIDQIAVEAERQRVAALWIDDQGATAESRALAPFVMWRSS